MMVNDSETSPLKLCDFGLSKIMGPGETCSDPFGTISYVAPEVLLQRPYGFEVDLWSLGIMLYILLSGLLPYDDPDQKEIAKQVIYEPVPFHNKVWDTVSPEAIELIKGLLEKKQRKRIGLEEVLNHKWITKDKALQARRRSSGFNTKFEAYTTTVMEEK